MYNVTQSSQENYLSLDPTSITNLQILNFHDFLANRIVFDERNNNKQTRVLKMSENS